MDDRTRSLLEHLDANRDALWRAVEATPAALRQRRPAPDRWSVAEVLDHLGLVEQRLTAMLTDGIAGIGARPPQESRSSTPVSELIDSSIIVDRTRPITAGNAVLPRTSADVTTARLALERSRAALIEHVMNAEGLACDRFVRPHPVLGPIDWYQWIAFIGFHEARHTAQIRETTAKLTRTQ
jgi:hypothetical protein